jgi:hypothetical protein
MAYARSSLLAILIATMFFGATPDPVVTTEAVPVDGLEFMLKALTVVEVPEDKPTPVQIALKVKNTSAGNIHLNLVDTIRLHLTDAAGNKLNMDGGRNASRPLPPLVVGKDETVTIDRNAQLKPMPKKPGKLRLIGDDPAGGIWYFDDLAPGKYTLTITYQNKPDERAAAGSWTGKAETKPLAFEITDAPPAARK